MPQAMKIPDAKAAVYKEWKKLETIPAWQLDKMKSKKDVILEAQRMRKKVLFATHTRFCSASDCIGSVWTREYSKQRTTELFQIEDISDTTCWSDGQDAQLQSSERKDWSRSSGQESKRDKSHRWQESGRECSQWKANLQCSRGDSCSSSHGSNRGKKVQACSLVPIAQSQTDERKPSKGFGPRGESVSGRKGRKPCKKIIKWKCTDPSCDYWHPPVCQNYMSETGCIYGDDCYFRHFEAEEKPSKKSKKGGAKGAVALLKESTQLGCVAQDSHPRKGLFYVRKVGMKSHRHNSSKGTWHHRKFFETKKVHRKE